MPRRKAKHLYVPGQSGNPAGRPRGVPNKIQISEQVREAFAQLLDGAVPHLQDWLTRTAQRNPDKALDLWVKISERFVPSLQRTEITGKDGEAFTPINIQLPNIPKIGLSVGGTLTDNPLLSAPAEEVKAIGEGAPSTFVNGVSFLDSPVLPIETPGPMDPPVDQPPVEAPSQMFQVPPLTLSPNQLKDLADMGEHPPVPQGDMGEPTT